CGRMVCWHATREACTMATDFASRTSFWKIPVSPLRTYEYAPRTAARPPRARDTNPETRYFAEAAGILASAGVRCTARAATSATVSHTTRSAYAAASWARINGRLITAPP